VISGAFNNKSVHFVGVIIVWLSTCTEGQQLKFPVRFNVILYMGDVSLPWSKTEEGLLKIPDFYIFDWKLSNTEETFRPKSQN
jgi:hypothetical protein